MERMLKKLAQQLNAYDEASLMALWEKYAAEVEAFKPTKQWEEAALIFSMIQSVRWKNQLFNFHWSQSCRPSGRDVPPQSAYMGMTLEDVPAPGASAENDLDEAPSETSAQSEIGRNDCGPDLGNSTKKGAKILSFRPREDD